MRTSSPITRESIVKPAENVLWNTIDDEAVVLNINNGYYYTLSPVALSMWNACDGTSKLYCIADALTQVYDATPEQLEHDLIIFIRECLRESLMVVVGSPEPGL